MLVWICLQGGSDYLMFRIRMDVQQFIYMSLGNRILTCLLLSFPHRDILFGMIFRGWQRKGKRYKTSQTRKLGFTDDNLPLSKNHI